MSEQEPPPGHPAADKPILPGKVARFINYYCEDEDVPIAALRAGITTSKGMSLLRRRDVKKAVNDRLDVIHTEQAKLLAKHRNKVTIPLLDDALVTAIEKGSRRGDTAALMLGYQRVGMMREREFIGVTHPSQALAGATGQRSSPIYRAERITHTTTVTERAEVEGAAAPAPNAEKPEEQLTLPAPTILRY